MKSRRRTTPRASPLVLTRQQQQVTLRSSGGLLSAATIKSIFSFIALICVLWLFESAPGASGALPVMQVSSNDKAYVAVFEDGTVQSWGDENYGGYGHETFLSQLQNVSKVYGNGMAFAAVLINGSVVTWGNPSAGGNSSAVRPSLVNIVKVFSTRRAFAALSQAGQVVTWGYGPHGGDSSNVAADLLSGVQTICSNDVAFLAVKFDGSVVSWPSYNQYGGNSTSVLGKLKNIQGCGGSGAVLNNLSPPLNVPSAVTYPRDCNYVSTSGPYFISPAPNLPPVKVFCDLDTPGGPWMLTYSYRHLKGLDNQPVPGKIPTDPWRGYSHVALSNIPGFNKEEMLAVRFFCQTSAHNRTVNFYTPNNAVRDIAWGGVPVANATQASDWSQGFTILPGHSAHLPAATDYTVSSSNFLDSPFAAYNMYRWTVYGNNINVPPMSSVGGYDYFNSGQGLLDLTAGPLTFTPVSLKKTPLTPVFLVPSPAPVFSVPAAGQPLSARTLMIKIDAVAPNLNIAEIAVFYRSKEQFNFQVIASSNEAKAALAVDGLEKTSWRSNLRDPAPYIALGMNGLPFDTVKVKPVGYHPKKWLPGDLQISVSSDIDSQDVYWASLFNTANRNKTTGYYTFKVIVSPTTMPSARPTHSPTTATPTLARKLTFVPSVAPTPIPTVTPKPTTAQIPTLGVRITGNPTSRPTNQWSMIYSYSYSSALKPTWKFTGHPTGRPTSAAQFPTQPPAYTARRKFLRLDQRYKPGYRLNIPELVISYRGVPLQGPWTVTAKGCSRSYISANAGKMFDGNVTTVFSACDADSWINIDVTDRVFDSITIENRYSLLSGYDSMPTKGYCQFSSSSASGTSFPSYSFASCKDKCDSSTSDCQAFSIQYNNYWKNPSLSSVTCYILGSTAGSGPILTSTNQDYQCYKRTTASRPMGIDLTGVVSKELVWASISITNGTSSSAYTYWSSIFQGPPDPEIACGHYNNPPPRFIFNIADVYTKKYLRIDGLSTTVAAASQRRFYISEVALFKGQTNVPFYNISAEMQNLNGVQNCSIYRYYANFLNQKAYGSNNKDIYYAAIPTWFVTSNGPANDDPSNLAKLTDGVDDPTSNNYYMSANSQGSNDGTFLFVDVTGYNFDTVKITVPNSKNCIIVNSRLTLSTSPSASIDTNLFTSFFSSPVGGAQPSVAYTSFYNLISSPKCPSVYTFKGASGLTAMPTMATSRAPAVPAGNPATGKFLRIDLVKMAPLQLAEIQFSNRGVKLTGLAQKVYASPCFLCSAGVNTYAAQNVEDGKPATFYQSSLGIFNPYIVVDVTASVFDKIVVLNRQDGIDQGNILGARIAVTSDFAGQNVLWNSTFNSATTRDGGMSFTFVPTGPLIARVGSWKPTQSPTTTLQFKKMRRRLLDATDGEGAPQQMGEDSQRELRRRSSISLEDTEAIPEPAQAAARGLLGTAVQMALYPAQDFSIQAWVYVSNFALSSTGKAAVYALGSINSGTGLLLRVSPSAGVELLLNGNPVMYGGKGEILPNVWQHIAVTRCGGVLRLFIDGTRVLYVKQYAPLDSVPRGKVLIGANPDLPSERLFGYISNIEMLMLCKWSYNYDPGAPPQQVMPTFRPTAAPTPKATFAVPSPAPTFTPPYSTAAHTRINIVSSSDLVFAEIQLIYRGRVVPILASTITLLGKAGIVPGNFNCVDGKLQTTCQLIGGGDITIDVGSLVFDGVRLIFTRPIEPPTLNLKRVNDVTLAISTVYTASLVASGIVGKPYTPGSSFTFDLSCPAGSYSMTGMQPCAPCSSRLYSPEGASTYCDFSPICQASTYAAVPTRSGDSCQACPVGKYSTGVGRPCVVSPNGMYVVGLTALNCTSGFYSIGGAYGSCPPCPTGYTSDVMASGCYKTRPGTFYNIAQSIRRALPCPTGSFSVAYGAFACQPCWDGYTTLTDGLTTCTPAPAGYYTTSIPATLKYPFTRTVVRPCPAGTSSGPGSAESTSCIPCALGFYADTVGSIACKISPASFFPATHTYANYSLPPAYAYTASNIGATSSTLTAPSAPYLGDYVMTPDTPALGNNVTMGIYKISISSIEQNVETIAKLTNVFDGNNKTSVAGSAFNQHYDTASGMYSGGFSTGNLLKYRLPYSDSSSVPSNAPTSLPTGFYFGLTRPIFANNLLQRGLVIPTRFTLRFDLSVVSQCTGNCDVLSLLGPTSSSVGDGAIGNNTVLRPGFPRFFFNRNSPQFLSVNVAGGSSPIIQQYAEKTVPGAWFTQTVTIDSSANTLTWTQVSSFGLGVNTSVVISINPLPSSWRTFDLYASSPFDSAALANIRDISLVDNSLPLTPVQGEWVQFNVPGGLIPNSYQFTTTPDRYMKKWTVLTSTDANSWLPLGQVTLTEMCASTYFGNLSTNSYWSSTADYVYFRLVVEQQVMRYTLVDTATSTLTGAVITIDPANTLLTYKPLDPNDPPTTYAFDDCGGYVRISSTSVVPGSTLAIYNDILATIGKSKTSCINGQCGCIPGYLYRNSSASCVPGATTPFSKAHGSSTQNTGFQSAIGPAALVTLPAAKGIAFASEAWETWNYNSVWTVQVNSLAADTSNTSTSGMALGFDGTIYLGASDSTLYAVSPSGSKMWSALTTLNPLEQKPIKRDPALSATTVYVLSSKLYAFAASDGTRAWKSPWTDTCLRDDSSNLIINSAADTLYFSGMFVGSGVGKNKIEPCSKFYAVSSAGSTKWTAAVQGSLLDPALSQDEKTVYVVSSKTVYAFSTADGKSQWKVSTQNVTSDAFNFTTGAVVAPSGNIYIGAGNSVSLVGYLITLGKLGNIVSTVTSIDGYPLTPLTISPALSSDGKVFVPVPRTSNAGLNGYDTSSGSCPGTFEYIDYSDSTFAQCISYCNADYLCKGFSWASTPASTPYAWSSTVTSNCKIFTGTGTIPVVTNPSSSGPWCLIKKTLFRFPPTDFAVGTLGKSFSSSTIGPVSATYSKFTDAGSTATYNALDAVNAPYLPLNNIGFGTYTVSASSASSSNVNLNVLFDGNTNAEWNADNSLTTAAKNSKYDDYDGAYSGTTCTPIVKTSPTKSDVCGEWIQLQLPVATVLASYSWQANNPPVAFEVLASTDSVNWNLAFTSFLSAGDPFSFTTTPVNNVGLSSYFRFVVTRVRTIKFAIGTNPANVGFGVTELALFGTPRSTPARLLAFGTPDAASSSIPELKSASGRCQGNIVSPLLVDKTGAVFYTTEMGYVASAGKWSSRFTTPSSKLSTYTNSITALTEVGPQGLVISTDGSLLSVQNGLLRDVATKGVTLPTPFAPVPTTASNTNGMNTAHLSRGFWLKISTPTSYKPSAKQTFKLSDFSVTGYPVGLASSGADTIRQCPLSDGYNSIASTFCTGKPKVYLLIDQPTYGLSPTVRVQEIQILSKGVVQNITRLSFTASSTKQVNIGTKRVVYSVANAKNKAIDVGNYNATKDVDYFETTTTDQFPYLYMDVSDLTFDQVIVWNSDKSLKLWNTRVSLVSSPPVASGSTYTPPSIFYVSRFADVPALSSYSFEFFCPAGMYSLTGIYPCSICPPGMTSKSVGGKFCLPTDTGYTTNPSLSKIFPGPPKSPSYLLSPLNATSSANKGKTVFYQSTKYTDSAGVNTFRWQFAASSVVSSNNIMTAFDGRNTTYYNEASVLGTYNGTGVYNGTVYSRLQNGTYLRGEWLQVTFPFIPRVWSYIVSSPVNTLGRPSSFVLLGRSNNADQLWSVVDYATKTNATVRQSTVTAKEPYLTYRLVFLAVAVPTPQNGRPVRLRVCSLAFIVDAPSGIAQFLCPAGTYSSYNKVCMLCPSGQFSLPGQTSCSFGDSSSVPATTFIDEKLSPAALASLNTVLTTRLVMRNYSGPIFTLRRSSDNSQADFYADANGLLGTSLSAGGNPASAWKGTDTLFVAMWFDQSINANHAFQLNPDFQPVYDLVAKAVNFTGGKYLNTTVSALPTTSSSYSFVINEHAIPSLATIAPTMEPTGQPTGQPSREPTRTPTGQPSSQPSRQPSRHPSSQPSRQPSRSPSAQPNSRPSSQPSRHPSSQPSSQPSIQPSSPSSDPTRQPSSLPSSLPSARPSKPTFMPSILPSSTPSGQPTITPSKASSRPTPRPTNPTSQPTGQPSRQPSSQPSFQPTSPSSQPTRRPSSQPSSLPTNPTGQPSRQPTRQPTSQPNGRPSAQPSRQPTRKPSSQPSRQPTAQPSRQPSSHPSRPSSQPTRRPTCQPTGQPTSKPVSYTSRPSGQPSSRPTSRPSGQPSRTPSVQPTSEPSRAPTSRPTRHPLSKPTGQPSRKPSGQPTRQPTSRPTRPSYKPTWHPTTYVNRRLQSSSSSSSLSLSSDTAPFEHKSRRLAVSARGVGTPGQSSYMFTTGTSTGDVSFGTTSTVGVTSISKPPVGEYYINIDSLEMNSLFNFSTVLSLSGIQIFNGETPVNLTNDMIRITGVQSVYYSTSTLPAGITPAALVDNNPATALVVANASIHIMLDRVPFDRIIVHNTNKDCSFATNETRLYPAVSFAYPSAQSSLGYWSQNFWTLGASGGSCSAACSSYPGYTCSAPSIFDYVNNNGGLRLVTSALQSYGTSIRCTYLKSNADVVVNPSLAPDGNCYSNTVPMKSTCGAMSTGYKRICPCYFNATSTSFGFTVFSYYYGVGNYVGSASSTATGGRYPVLNAFDANLNSSWVSASVYNSQGTCGAKCASTGATYRGEWVQLMVPQSFAPKTLILIPSSINGAPTSMALLGSNTGSSWTLIKNFTRAGTTATTISKSYVINIASLASVRVGSILSGSGLPSSAVVLSIATSTGSVTGTVTAGNSKILVGSLSGISVGTVVTGAAFSAGTFVTTIVGKTLTLSLPPIGDSTAINYVTNAVTLNAQATSTVTGASLTPAADTAITISLFLQTTRGVSFPLTTSLRFSYFRLVCRATGGGSTSFGLKDFKISTVSTVQWNRPPAMCRQRLSGARISLSTEGYYGNDPFWSDRFDSSGATSFTFTPFTAKRFLRLESVPATGSGSLRDPYIYRPITIGDIQLYNAGVPLYNFSVVSSAGSSDDETGPNGVFNMFDGNVTTGWSSHYGANAGFLGLPFLAIDVSGRKFDRVVINNLITPGCKSCYTALSGVMMYLTEDVNATYVYSNYTFANTYSGSYTFLGPFAGLDNLPTKYMTMWTYNAPFANSPTYIVYKTDMSTFRSAPTVIPSQLSFGIYSTTGGVTGGVFSMEAWVKGVPWDATAGIINYGGGSAGFGILIQQGIQVIMRGKYILLGSQLLTAFTPGQWIHVCLTRDGNTISAYFNGTLIDTFVSEQSRTWRFGPSDITLGSALDYTVSPSRTFGFAGIISDFAFYNTTKYAIAGFTPPPVGWTANTTTFIGPTRNASTVGDTFFAEIYDGDVTNTMRGYLNNGVMSKPVQTLPNKPKINSANTMIGGNTNMSIYNFVTSNITLSQPDVLILGALNPSAAAATLPATTLYLRIDQRTRPGKVTGISIADITLSNVGVKVDISKQAVVSKPGTGNLGQGCSAKPAALSDASLATIFSVCNATDPYLYIDVTGLVFDTISVTTRNYLWQPPLPNRYTMRVTYDYNLNPVYTYPNLAHEYVSSGKIRTNPSQLAANCRAICDNTPGCTTADIATLSRYTFCLTSSFTLDQVVFASTGSAPITHLPGGGNASYFGVNEFESSLTTVANYKANDTQVLSWATISLTNTTDGSFLYWSGQFSGNTSTLVDTSPYKTFNFTVAKPITTNNAFTACPLGTYSTGVKCLPCPPGTYKDYSLTVCTPLGPNQYATSLSGTLLTVPPFYTAVTSVANLVDPYGSAAQVDGSLKADFPRVALVVPPSQDIPTLAPTALPTSAPTTALPTALPTPSPTSASPTPVPSETTPVFSEPEPSAAPSPAPTTIRPTSAPTPSPTGPPTVPVAPPPLSLLAGGVYLFSQSSTFNSAVSIGTAVDGNMATYTQFKANTYSLADGTYLNSSRTVFAYSLRCLKGPIVSSTDACKVRPVTLAGEWIQMKFPTRVAPMAVSLYIPPPQRALDIWILGSTDGTNWVFMDHKKNFDVLANSAMPLVWEAFGYNNWFSPAFLRVVVVRALLGMSGVGLRVSEFSVQGYPTIPTLSGGSNAVSCNDGWALQPDQTCVMCRAGSFFNAVNVTCSPCAAGSYSTDASLSCRNCPPGMSSSAGASICAVCTPGTYVAVPGGLCVPIPTGSFANYAMILPPRSLLTVPNNNNYGPVSPTLNGIYPGRGPYVITVSQPPVLAAYSLAERTAILGMFDQNTTTAFTLRTGGLYAASGRYIGNTKTSFLTALAGGTPVTVKGEYVGINFPLRIMLQPGSFQPTLSASSPRTIAAWYLLGSLDSKSWVLVDSFVAPGSGIPSILSAGVTPSPGLFWSFRLVISSVSGLPSVPATPVNLQIAELRFPGDVELESLQYPYKYQVKVDTPRLCPLGFTSLQGSTLCTYFTPTVNQRFYPVNSVQTFTIPAGVNMMRVKMWGGGGSGSGVDPAFTTATGAPGGVSYAGGAGAFTQCYMPVTPGETLQVVVGGGGFSGPYTDMADTIYAQNGGFSGGGTSILRSTPPISGPGAWQAPVSVGSGGGMSAVRRMVRPASMSPPVMATYGYAAVAGGGGGAGIGNGTGSSQMLAGGGGLPANAPVLLPLLSYYPTVTGQGVPIQAGQLAAAVDLPMKYSFSFDIYPLEFDNLLASNAVFAEIIRLSVRVDNNRNSSVGGALPAFYLFKNTTSVEWKLYWQYWGDNSGGNDHVFNSTTPFDLFAWTTVTSVIDFTTSQPTMSVSVGGDTQTNNLLKGMPSTWPAVQVWTASNACFGGCRVVNARIRNVFVRDLLAAGPVGPDPLNGKFSMFQESSAMQLSPGRGAAITSASYTTQVLDGGAGGGAGLPGGFAGFPLGPTTLSGGQGGASYLGNTMIGCIYSSAISLGGSPGGVVNTPGQPAMPAFTSDPDYLPGTGVGGAAMLSRPSGQYNLSTATARGGDGLVVIALSSVAAPFVLQRQRYLKESQESEEVQPAEADLIYGPSPSPELSINNATHTHRQSRKLSRDDQPADGSNWAAPPSPKPRPTAPSPRPTPWTQSGKPHARFFSQYSGFSIVYSMAAKRTLRPTRPTADLTAFIKSQEAVQQTAQRTFSRFECDNALYGSNIYSQDTTHQVWIKISDVQSPSPSRSPSSSQPPSKRKRYPTPSPTARPTTPSQLTYPPTSSQPTGQPSSTKALKSPPPSPQPSVNAPVAPVASRSPTGQPTSAPTGQPTSAPSNSPKKVSDMMQFGFTGAVQTFIVPNNITTVYIDLYGAQGGSAGGNMQGGKGGHLRAALKVTSGQSLYVLVGGAGGDAYYNPASPSGLFTGTGGWNGGGYGALYPLTPFKLTDLFGGGGGGGASEIRLFPDQVTSRVLVAGGGGGALIKQDFSASYPGGAGGGPVGRNGGIGKTTTTPGIAATGGSQSSGGLAAQNAPDGSCGASCQKKELAYGHLGTGGSLEQNKNKNECSGGGGGGGHYGGGAGCLSGGAGGSSYARGPSMSNEQGVNSGNGRAIISW